MKKMVTFRGASPRARESAHAAGFVNKCCGAPLKRGRARRRGAMQDAGGLAAYLDESGTRGGADGHFVLACVAGDEGSIARLAGGLRGVKLGLVPGADPDAWEFHAREIMHGGGGTPLRRRDGRERAAAIRMAVSAVCASGAAPAAVAVRNAGPGRPWASRATRRASSILVARLERLAAARGMPCRVVSDSVRGGHRRDMERALLRAARGRVTGIEYVDSRASAPVQAADALAYAVGRHMAGDARFGEAFAEVERCAWLNGGWGGVRVVEASLAARKRL